MEIIYVDTIDYSELKEEYLNNIIVPKNHIAMYVLADRTQYSIPQRLLDEIIFLQNLDPAMDEQSDCENKTEPDVDKTLSVEELKELSESYTGEELCNLREVGLI